MHIEPLLQNTANKYVNLPIRNPDIENFYVKHVDAIWHVADVKQLATDIQHWAELSDDERYFIKHVLAFFAASDGIIMENIFANFGEEVQMSEARSFYAFQNFMEDIHSRTYSKLIVTYIDDPSERDYLLNGIETMPGVMKKARWAEKWLNKDISFVKRLVAFMIVEHLFFCTSFAAINFIREKGVMPGLCFANEYISRDESLHVDFAIHLYNNYVVGKLDQIEMNELINEAVEIEKYFTVEALPCRLLGMNADMMCQYVEYMAHNLMVRLKYVSPWTSVKNPFPFMNKQALQVQTSFFDKDVADYKKNINMEKKTAKNMTIVTDADF